MLYNKDFSAIMNMNASGKLGKVQTLSVSANYATKTASKEELKNDLVRLTLLAGGNIDVVDVVASKKHFPHGIVTLYMKDATLVRYSFTEMNVKGRKEWGVYATDAEVYFNEGENHIELKIPVADIKAEVYTTDEWCKDATEKTVSKDDEKRIDEIVNQLL